MSRFTTHHCEKGARTNRFVPATCLQTGDLVGHCLTAIGIAIADAPWAFASCLIQIMGKDAHNDEGEALRSVGSSFTYGQRRWVHTRMETGGAVPSERWQRRPTGRFAWADSFDGANDILGCFGLTISDVLDYFGNVDAGERKIFDLKTIVEALAPEIIVQARQAQSA